MQPTRIADVADARAPGEGLVGRQVGDYRVLECLGQGGMGTVYAAQQEHPRRRVALKVLNAGRASPSLLRRFEHEAQILARLQHPCIAQIHAAGSFDLGAGAQPYIAMEHVDGLPLVEHAMRHRLDLRQRLQLVMRLCEGVQHAHQRAVIHRDLKPGNVLVQAEAAGPGLPKILDFGIARVLDEGGEVDAWRTDEGQVLGTLAYMSPEQASGDRAAIDTRSDVYAIGVIAFELLAGCLPHDLRGLRLHEAVARICEEDAPRLGRYDRRLRGDLELIIATALQRERSRRYQSVVELAADLEAFLDRRPIRARPPSRRYRLGRFLVRNKALVAGMLMLFLSLAGGLLLSSSEYRRAEAHRLQAELRAAQLQQVAAMQAAQLAAIDVAAIGKDLRQGIRLALGKADAEIELEDVDFPALAQEMLDRHLLRPTLAAIDVELAEQPLVQAQLLQTLATSWRAMGRHGEAETLQRRALDLREAWLGEHHLATLEAAAELAIVLDLDGRYDEAGPLAQRVLDGRRRLLGEAHPDSLRAQLRLGIVWIGEGRPGEALAMLESAMAGLRRALGDSHADALDALNALGMAHALSGKLQMAENLLTEALKRYRSSFGAEHVGTLRALNNLGFVHDLALQHARAEPLYREAWEARRRISGEDHPDTLTALNNLAVVLSDLGQREQAQEYFRSVLDGRRRVLGEQHPDTLGALSNLAAELQQSGQLDEAEQLVRAAIDAARRRLPHEHWHLGVFIGNLGAILRARGSYRKAEEHLLDSQRILAAALGEDHPETQIAVERLVGLYREWQDPERSTDRLLVP